MLLVSYLGHFLRIIFIFSSKFQRSNFTYIFYLFICIFVKCYGIVLTSFITLFSSDSLFSAINFHYLALLKASINALLKFSLTFPIFLTSPRAWSQFFFFKRSAHYDMISIAEIIFWLLLTIILSWNYLLVLVVKLMLIFLLYFLALHLTKDLHHC